MTKIEILKMALISRGYVKNIKIEQYHDSYGEVLYEISAESMDYYLPSNNEEIIETNTREDMPNDYYRGDCMDFVTAFMDIIKCGQSKTCGQYWRTNQLTQKALMDDETREKIFKEWAIEDQIDKEVDEEMKDLRSSLQEWQKENNPCSDNCSDNKHDCDWDGGMWHHCRHLAIGGDTGCQKLVEYRQANKEKYKEIDTVEKEVRERISKKYARSY